MGVARPDEDEIVGALRSGEVERAGTPEAEPEPAPKKLPHLSSLLRTSNVGKAPRRVSLISDFEAHNAARPEPEPPAEKPLDGPSDEPTSAKTGNSASLSAGLEARERSVGADLTALTDRIAELEKTCAKQANQIEQLLQSTKLLQESTSGLVGRCDTESQKCESLRAALAMTEAGLEEANRASEARLRSEIEVQDAVLTNLVQQLREERSQDLDRLENEKAARLALAEVLEAAARTLQERHTGRSDAPPARREQMA